MGLLSLPAGGRVYVDTQVVIYTVERHPHYGPSLVPLWEASRAGTIEVITSELTLMETLIQPIRKGDAQLQRDYETALLQTELSLVSITRAILQEAARLRATTTALRTPDAIHAATAQLSDYALFLTNDRGLQRVPGLKTVILDDVLSA